MPYPNISDSIVEANGKIYGRKALTETPAEIVSVDSSNVMQLGAGVTAVNAAVLRVGTVPVAGAVAAGYKIARGEAAFDGSNPTTVASGLTTVISVQATLKGTAAPGDNTSIVTCNINGTDVDYYAWKNTGGTDPTLVASTGTESFYWFAIGT